jgi:hypothetical protein
MVGHKARIHTPHGTIDTLAANIKYMIRVLPQPISES